MTDNLMGLSIPHLRRWGAPWPVDHRQLNEPVDVLNDMARGVRGPRQMMPGAAGKAAAAVVSVAASFRLKQNGSLHGDYLWCRRWNTETHRESGEDIFVAKPPSLQRSTLDGETRAGIRYSYTGNVSRTATRVSDNASERQTVIDQYWLGDIIVATTPIEGGTGVYVDESPLIWMDDNRAGRAWAAQFVEP